MSGAGMDQTIKHLRALIAAQEVRIAALEDAVGIRAADQFPAPLRPMQRTILGILAKRGSITKTGLLQVLYGHRPERDWPDNAEKVIDVELHHLRRALTPFGIEIMTQAAQRGHDATAYCMPSGSRAKVKMLVADARSACPSQPETDARPAA
jgi:hypothetical protein